jgi:hypothetical protein
MALGGVAIAVLTMAVSARADAYWGGVFDSNWANLGNWGGTGDPANAAGATIINPGNHPCVVSTTGNTTSGDCYISIGVGLSVVSGGQLTVAANFITGQWGNSLPVDVTGQLTINGWLLTGNGGYDGDVSISSGGTVESAQFSMNTGGGAKMDISTNGTFITSIAQLGNVNYWIANNAITANGNAPGWAIKVDTNSLVNKLKLTAIYTPPPATSTNFVFDNGGGNNLWTNKLNWNPDGQPGLIDTATVAGGLYVILNAGTEGNVGKLFVGAANGEGAVNFNTGCNVSFRDTTNSLVVGGVTNSGIYPSYCIFNGGSVGTIGDLIFGGSDGWVDARHYGGTVNLGGWLRLGSYLYSSPTSPTNASLRLIGSTGGFGSVGGGIEIGDAGTLSYEFNGGSAIKALVTAGAVNISSEAVLVVDGTGYAGSTGDMTLLQGSTLTGTFSTAIITNFPSGVTASVSYTATRLKLSVVVSQPNFGLTITKLGGATNQISWNFGNIMTATNVTGPWRLDQCATSPLIEVATSGSKFYRGVLLGTLYRYDNESGNNLWTTALNWNPDGTPGASDDTVVANSRSAYVTSAAGTVGSVIVGDSSANGALNINPGGSIEFANPCVSVIIGGTFASPNNYGSYYRQGGGDLTTAGDLVFGSSGGKADAEFAGPGQLTIGGTLRLGSYKSAGQSFFVLPGDAGTITAGGLEVGSAGELVFNFNGGAALKTISVSGGVSLLAGSQLTIRGNGYSNGSGTYNYTLIAGGARAGTFAAVNVSSFPVGGTTATIGYSVGNVTLQVVVP